MKDNGTIVLMKGKNRDYHWDITLVDNEITLYSNGYYLGYNRDLKKIISNKYMERLNYINTKDEDYIIKTDNNLFISIKDNSLILDNSDNYNYSVFQLLDIY